jgi:16S rRNA (guanine527-N7)-methyltransferase
MSPRRPVNDRPTRLPLGRDGFARLIDVSRETLARLDAYVGLLQAWNRRINLVGATTMGDPWRRHILDSAQLLAFLPPDARSLVDLGSGAGLPGLILAILGVPEVHLVESDQRKAAFLREAARISGTSVQIHAERAERLGPLKADIVTARAVAPLPDLLDIAERFLSNHSICLFLKGRGAGDEMAEAAQRWDLAARREGSRSEPGASIVIVERLARKISP